MSLLTKHLTLYTGCMFLLGIMCAEVIASDEDDSMSSFRRKVHRGSNLSHAGGSSSGHSSAVTLTNIEGKSLLVHLIQYELRTRSIVFRTDSDSRRHALPLDQLSEESRDVVIDWVIKDAINRQLKIDARRRSAGGTNEVVEFTVYNGSRFPIKDLSVSCSVNVSRQGRHSYSSPHQLSSPTSIPEISKTIDLAPGETVKLTTREFKLKSFQVTFYESVSEIDADGNVTTSMRKKRSTVTERIRSMSARVRYGSSFSKSWKL